MEILTFKTNIASPASIQAIWDSLKTIGVKNYNITYNQFWSILKIAPEQYFNEEDIITAITKLGFNCQQIKTEKHA